MSAPITILSPEEEVRLWKALQAQWSERVQAIRPGWAKLVAEAGLSHVPLEAVVHTARQRTPQQILRELDRRR